MVNNKTLTEQAYGKLKKMILDRKLRPNEKIGEVKTAELLKVSRTTVRKAFATLVEEGFLVETARKSVEVRSYSKSEILEIYDLREVTAGLCARYAALNISKKDIIKLTEIYARMEEAVKKKDKNAYIKCDIDFHDLIIRCSESAITASIITKYSIQMHSFNYGLIRDPSETIGEHKQIIEVLNKGDPDLAEITMRRHIKGSRERLAEIFEERK